MPQWKKQAPMIVAQSPSGHVLWKIGRHWIAKEEVEKVLIRSISGFRAVGGKISLAKGSSSVRKWVTCCRAISYDPEAKQQHNFPTWEAYATEVWNLTFEQLLWLVGFEVSVGMMASTPISDRSARRYGYRRAIQ